LRRVQSGYLRRIEFSGSGDFVSATQRIVTGPVIAVLSALLFSHTAHAASLMACMAAHKEEMKALNTQIAGLEKTKVAPGGPKTKLSDCAHRLEAIRGSALIVTADKNSADHREKISCLSVKKTLLEQKCVCEAKGYQFSSDPAVIDNTLAAQKRFADAQKAARKASGSLRSSPEVRDIAKEVSKLRGCYSAQVIDIINKSTAAVEKIAQAKR
jgi:hypothetical protein